MAETARKALITTLVAAGVVVLALALWKLRLVVALLFAGFIVAAAIYLVNPRVMGSAVGMSPLVVLFSASAVVFLFGGFAVLLAVPIAAVLVTLVDVIVRDRNPAEEEAPTVLFPAAKEADR